MKEIARHVNRRDKTGFSVVSAAPALTTGRPPGLWNGKPVQGTLTHLGCDSDGCEVFRLDQDPNARTWALATKGEANPVEGAALVHRIEGLYNGASLLLIGPRAIVTTDEHRESKRTLLYVDGEETKCDNTESVLIALGIRKAAGTPRPVPAVPAPSRGFLAALEKGEEPAEDGDDILASVERCPTI